MEDIQRVLKDVVHSIMEDIQRVLKDMLNKGIKEALCSVSVPVPFHGICAAISPTSAWSAE